MENVLRPEVRSDWFAAVGAGMRLEISATVNGLGHQLIIVLADERDESLWVQVFAGDTAVQIPIDVLQNALKAAVGEVRSENWYDKNQKSDAEP
jgi:hypothetical protein